jgi:ABC-type branched-subunit amino acid transport system ATPase component
MTDPAVPTRSVPESSAPIIMQVSNLAKSFGGIKAVRGVSFTVQRGKATSLVGPNGAGKTTIFNLITGEIAADSGSVIFEGKELRGSKPSAVAQLGVSRTFQDLRLFQTMTVLDNVMVSFQKQKGENPSSLVIRPWAVRRQERALKEKALEILTTTGLLARQNVKASTLSYAEQKLLVISRSIAMEADVWLLDEPASGLDGDALIQFSELLRALVDAGQTVLIVEHNLRLVQKVSDWVLFLDQGELKAEGTPDEIFASKELQELYIGGGTTE